MHIEIYSKTGCAQCDEAERIVQATEHTYNKLMLDNDFTRDQLFEIFPTARTFPQIMVDGNAIGGLQQLKEVL